MRWAMAAAILLTLAGCKKSFDERYSEAEKKIRDQAASIDKEMAQREKEEREAEALMSDAPPPTASASGT